jgi:competence protein ComGC
LDKGENNMQEQKTVGQAIASLVLGILSFLMFGLLTAIPAVICGHLAKSKIKSDPETLKGDGQALAGLIMGYIVIGFTVLMIPMLAAIGIPSFQKARSASIEKTCENNQRIIESAKEQYALEQNLTDGVTVSEGSIGVYIQGDFSAIQCMEQGVYTINPIGVHPECSVHGFPE